MRLQIWRIDGLGVGPDRLRGLPSRGEIRTHDPVAERETRPAWERVLSSRTEEPEWVVVAAGDGEIALGPLPQAGFLSGRHLAVIPRLRRRSRERLIDEVIGKPLADESLTERDAVAGAGPDPAAEEQHPGEARREPGGETLPEADLRVVVDRQVRLTGTGVRDRTNPDLRHGVFRVEADVDPDLTPVRDQHEDAVGRAGQEPL